MIKVNKITDTELLREMTWLTVNKELWQPNMNKYYKSVHSVIRTQIFKILMLDIPSFVSTHFVRHSAVWQLHFVKTNRDDRNWDKEANRLTPVNHWMILNAEHLIDMSKKRLCWKSHKNTIQVMEKIKNRISEIDKPLADNMLANCVHQWRCPEFSSCWYNQTDKYKQERKNFLNA